MRVLTITALVFGATIMSASADAFELRLQSSKPGGYTPVEESVTWQAQATAVILCDVWDAHHSINAVRRLEEFVPRMNEVVKEARERGAIIIHAPSDCMAAYAEHPARARAEAVTYEREVPDDAGHWVMQIESERGAPYPVEQSDGGEDDNLSEHLMWETELEGQGRNPGTPWKAQHPAIEIDSERDYVTDRGDEVWKILAANGIENVLLMGVHANMCVLGRPFGLRQQVRAGRNVALVRDMTDSMYRPESWPYVDHFTGHNLVLNYIEQHVCPTITSDQIIGGEPFRFADVPQGGASSSSPEPDPSDTWAPTDLTEGNLAFRNSLLTPMWLRCIVQPDAREVSVLELIAASEGVEARLDKVPLVERRQTDGGAAFVIPETAIKANVPQWVYIRVPSGGGFSGYPVLAVGDDARLLAGSWQLRSPLDKNWSPQDIPAQFGGAPSNFIPLGD